MTKKLKTPTMSGFTQRWRNKWIVIHQQCLDSLNDGETSGSSYTNNAWIYSTMEKQVDLHEHKKWMRKTKAQERGRPPAAPALRASPRGDRAEPWHDAAAAGPGSLGRARRRRGGTPLRGRWLGCLPHAAGTPHGLRGALPASAPRSSRACHLLARWCSRSSHGRRGRPRRVVQRPSGGLRHRRGAGGAAARGPRRCRPTSVSAAGSWATRRASAASRRLCAARAAAGAVTWP